MHLLETEFSRIYATADASRRWGDPWFPVIEEYAPPGRQVALVSGHDWRESERLYYSDPLTMRDEFTAAVNGYLLHRGPSISYGRHALFKTLNLSLVYVDVFDEPNQVALCLLHEVGHTFQKDHDGSWANKMRMEMQADQFSHHIFLAHHPGAVADIEWDVGQRLYDAYTTRSKGSYKHFPPSGVYLDVLHGKTPPALMQQAYFLLHNRITQYLGRIPHGLEDVVEATEDVLRRESRHSVIYPYAAHLLKSQQFMLSMAP